MPSRSEPSARLVLPHRSFGPDGEQPPDFFHGVIRSRLLSAKTTVEKASYMQRIIAENMTMFASALTNLLVDESAYITAEDFKRLTGDDLNSPITDGRFAMGNLAAKANCCIVSTGERMVFTKNPAHISAARPLSRK
jgi:hypothetical protein